MKILTWNIGCFFFLKYAKYLGIKVRGQKIKHEYFQPKLNGNFVSGYIEEMNPEMIFLQEFYSVQDTRSIEILKEYPYQQLLDTWYHEHSILVASKYEFTVSEKNTFSIISCKDLHIIPVHLNSFSAAKRLADVLILKEITKNLSNVVILGDTNIWSKGEWFCFKNDKKAYRTITEQLIDFSKNIISTSYIGLGLDKVFGSKNLSVRTIESPRNRGHHMDHYPIVIELE